MGESQDWGQQFECSSTATKAMHVTYTCALFSFSIHNYRNPQFRQQSQQRHLHIIWGQL